MRSRTPCGVDGVMSKPACSARPRTSAVASAARMSLRNCSATTPGVPAGTTSAAHGCISIIGAPASASVGTSGSLASRLRAATASGRRWPRAISPATVFNANAVKSTSPEATVVNRVLASLNGTCIICTPAARAKVSSATWTAWPLPSVP